MRNRIRWLEEHLVAPINTWSAWAVASLVLIALFTLIGWYFDDFRGPLICGAAMSAGVGARVAFKTTFGKEHQHGV